MLSLILLAIVIFDTSYGFSDVCKSSADRAFCIGRSGEGLVFYLYAFIISAIWHLADFLQMRKPKGLWLAALTSYLVFYLTLCVGGFCAVLLATGKFNYAALCGGPFVILMQDCYYTIPALSIPTIFFWLFLLALCLTKVAVAAISRLRRT